MTDLESPIGGKIAILLGAGFSYWASRLPLVHSLFDFRISILNERERYWLKKIKALKALWDKKYPNTNPEQFIEYILLNGSVRQRQHLLWYITRRLSDPFLATITHGVQTLMIDDSRKRLISGVRKAIKFFWQVKLFPLTGILTPNYDLLIEYSLGTKGFNYGTLGEKLYGRGKIYHSPWQGAWPALTGTLPVAKIHGSLSWTEDGTHYTDGRCGLKGKAHIVPPIHEKKQPLELKTVWQLAENILQTSSAILVFGFAFNPYDKALLELLRSGTNIRDVLLIDPSPNIAAAQKIWPQAKIATCLPPSSKSWKRIKTWLENVG